MFGDKSPWIMKKSGNKLVANWDDKKATKLGLTK